MNGHEFEIVWMLRDLMCLVKGVFSKMGFQYTLLKPNKVLGSKQ